MLRTVNNMLVEVLHAVAYSVWNKKALLYVIFFKLSEKNKNKKIPKKPKCILGSPRDVLTKIHLNSTLMYG